MGPSELSNGVVQVNGVGDHVNGVEDHVDGVENQVNGVENHVDGVKSQVNGVEDQGNGVKRTQRKKVVVVGLGMVGIAFMWACL